MKQMKIGAWPEMPPATAAAKWQELRAKRDAGEDLSRKSKLKIKAGPDAGYTLGQMVADYFTGYLSKRREAGYALAVQELPPSNRELIVYLLGALTVIVKHIYSFEFSSTRDSQVKTQLLAQAPAK